MGSIIPDPPDKKIFPIIQKALKEYAKGLYSQAQLAQFLDKEGLKEIRGKKTPLQLVDRILGSYLKFYAGILKNPWTGETIDGLHKPMITKEELYQIQLVRSGKSKTVKRDRYNPNFPLRRTVMCASCSHSLTGSASHGNGGTYYYYHCYNKLCIMIGKTVSKNKLEKGFLEYLKDITPKEKNLTLFKEVILDLWKQKGELFLQQAKKIEKQLLLLEAKRKRVFEMREDGSYSKEEFLERKEKVEDEVIEAKISLSETNIDEFDIKNTLTYTIGLIQDLKAQWFKLKPSSRHRFQKLIFPEGIPYAIKSGFRTTRLGLIYNLNQKNFTTKSHVVDYARISWNHIITELKAWQKLQAEIDRN